MQIASYNDCSELSAFAEAWDRLNEQELRFVPSFAELRHRLEAGRKFRLLVASENSQVVAVACFIYHDSIKRFEIATRKLFDLPVKMVSLFGDNVAGRPDEDVIRKFFQIIIDAGGFDVIDIGEIFVDSPLFRVISSLRQGFVAWRIMRTQQPRWMIRLPGSFDEYLASLRPTVNMRISRDFRRYERADPEFRVTHRPEDVESFLRDAETVSRLTYQWHIDYKTCNDEATRARLTRLAQNGDLRAYVAYVGGKPCAFGFGELSHRTFGFRSTGYDPQHRNISPGTALMLQIIRDLIENTDCEVFDFWSGSESGYKSRLATLGLTCARMQVAQITRPYPLLIVTLDRTINFVKGSLVNLTDFVLGSGALRQWLRRMLRPFGVGSY
jgi:hypothetical protein